jgi:hypothetical protein
MERSGIIKLRLWGGHNIKQMDMWSQSDTYVEVKCGAEEFKTATENDTDTPGWDQLFVLHPKPGTDEHGLATNVTPPIKLDVWDENLNIDRKFIGQVRIYPDKDLDTFDAKADVAPVNWPILDKYGPDKGHGSLSISAWWVKKKPVAPRPPSSPAGEEAEESEVAWLENQPTWTKNDAQHRSHAYRDVGDNGPATNVLDSTDHIWNADGETSSWILFDLQDLHEISGFKYRRADNPEAPKACVLEALDASRDEKPIAEAY